MPAAVASRYAEALADVVLDPKSGVSPQQAAAELRAVEEMIAGNSELRNVLLSPAVPASRKRAVIGRFAVEMPLSRLVRNLLYVLIDRRRGDILDEVREAFEAELDERLGVARAEVQSAVELDDAERAALENQLSRLTGKKVRVNYNVNQSLLGGIMAKIGSTIYDGSVRAQLERLHVKLAGS